MVGELAMGRFRVLERIGSGGMGTVYRALDERLQRYVALKEIEGAGAGRILREAQAAARLNHPAIAALYELGAEGDRVLLVSEHVEGATLTELSRKGGLSDRQVAEVGVDLCDALDHAHEHGVVHRDIKPQNIIVRADDDAEIRAKLMDFGIASVAGTPALTKTGEVVGTLAYMAPEQADGEEAGPEADLYSLALTLYECWAGVNPVARDSAVETARGIGARLPSLAEHRPDLPASLVACIDACIDADPAARPALAELRDDLAEEIPRLDDERRLTLAAKLARHPGEARERAVRWVALLGLGAAITYLAGPLERPGAAVVLGALILPGALASRKLAGTALPALAPILAAIGVAGCYPAAAGSLARGALRPALLGAVGWWWLLVAGAVLGGEPGRELLGRPPTGWESSASTAADSLLWALFEPQALLGMAAFAAAAAALSMVLRARVMALALLGALLWAACFEAALHLVAVGELDGRPAVLAAAAAVAVMLEHRGRRRAGGKPGGPFHPRAVLNYARLRWS